MEVTIIETINQRIAELLDALGITKTAFADKLKVSQQYISKLIRTGTPSDLLIDNICQRYNVNEVWLRTGEGEMFLPPEDEVGILVSQLIEEKDNPLFDIILETMRTFNQLTPDNQKVISSYCEKLLHNLKSKKES